MVCEQDDPHLVPSLQARLQLAGQLGFLPDWVDKTYPVQYWVCLLGVDVLT